MKDVYVYRHPDGEQPKITATIEIAEGVIADFDTNGELVGVEVLGVDRVEQDGYPTPIRPK